MKNLTLKDASINTDAIIRVLDQLKSRQAIVVIWEKGYHADLYLYESVNHKWTLADKIQANVGFKGMGKAVEGDQKSPVGIFFLATAFGIEPPPVGLKYPYRMVTGDDYWVDDSLSQFYNKWVRFKDGYWKDWNSAESLGRETVAYKYAVIINYNFARQPGKGSAIFLHVRKGESSPTGGCTAVPEEDMVRILQWLKFDKKPVIIQGSWADIMAISKDQITPLYGIPEGFIDVEDIIPDILVDTQYSTEGSLPNVAILTKQAARALSEAQKRLIEQDYCIKILDAYRPQRSTAFQSAHYRGSALDITLMDLKTGQEPDMGSKNRSMLRNVMESSGFKMGDNEWWHFTLVDEPFPNQYFNFPVRR